MPSEIKEPFAVADGYYTRAKAASSPVTILAELGVPENESQIAQLSKPEISRVLRALQEKIDKKVLLQEEPSAEDAAKELIMRAAGINRSDPPFGAVNVIKEQNSFVPIVRDIVDNPQKLFVITGPMGAGKSTFSNKLASNVQKTLEQEGSSLKVEVLDKDDYMAKDRKVPTLGVKDPRPYDPSTIYIVEGHGITRGVADTYYNRAVIDPVKKEIVSIGFFAPYDVAGERLRSRSREGDEVLITLFGDYYDNWYFGEDFSGYKYMVVSEIPASSPVDISRRDFIKKTAVIAGVVAVDPFATVKAIAHETKKTGITLPEIRRPRVIKSRDFVKAKGIPSGIHYVGEFKENRPTLVFIHGATGAPLNFREYLRSFGTGEYNTAVFAYDYTEPAYEAAGLLLKEWNSFVKEQPVGETVIAAHSYGNTVLRAAVLLDKSGSKFKDTKIVRIAPIPGGSEDAINASRGYRQFFANLFNRGHISIAADPYGEVQQVLYNERAVREYLNRVGHDTVITVDSDPYTPNESSDKTYRKFHENGLKSDARIILAPKSKDRQHTELLYEQYQPVVREIKKLFKSSGVGLPGTSSSPVRDIPAKGLVSITKTMDIAELKRINPKVSEQILQNTPQISIELSNSIPFVDINSLKNVVLKIMPLEERARFQESMGLIFGKVEGDRYTVDRIIPITRFSERREDWVNPDTKEVARLIEKHAVGDKKLIGAYHTRPGQRLLSNQVPGPSAFDRLGEDILLPEMRNRIVERPVCIVFEPAIDIENIRVEDIATGIKPSDINVFTYV
ncbi:MAG: twin-arginine translocation signal domain-containing protein, partial [Candidatus Omnitrophica bacterium]|nr:twin-arginine translocation signal domain-containing protein [Candidatus Omnitrophota bacterium]